MLFVAWELGLVIGGGLVVGGLFTRDRNCGPDEREEGGWPMRGLPWSRG